MATHTFTPLLGKRLRVTELDVCGAVDVNAMNIVTDGFITFTLSSEVEDGNEILVRNAAGQICVNERMSSSFKRFNVELEFCGVNPQLLAMTTNAEVYLDYAGDIAGFTVGEGEIDKKFAAELWTGLAGQACLPGQVDEASGYLLLPFIQSGVLGDITIEGENAVTFSLSGAYTKGGNAWGQGPYNVVRNDSGVASVLPTAIDPYDHLLLVDTALAPPPSSSEQQRVTPYGAVVAGAPGQFTPIGANAPMNIEVLKADPTIGDAAMTGPAWAATDYVVLGDGSQVSWDGSAWVPFA